MSVFGVILVRLFPHSDRIRRDTAYLHTDISYAVASLKCFHNTIHNTSIVTVTGSWQWQIWVTAINLFFHVWQFILNVYYLKRSFTETTENLMKMPELNQEMIKGVFYQSKEPFAVSCSVLRYWPIRSVTF